MTDIPPISIVLVTYNRAEALRGTLDSIIAQTFRDFELLVCDDASTDHTPLVVEEYAARDPRVLYHRRIRNLGMPGNLNEGIRRSRGVYVANLHDGDLYDPTLIEKWAAALERNPGAAFVFNQYRCLDDAGNTRTIEKEDFPPVFPGAGLLDEMFQRWSFGSPVFGTVMARRSAYVEVDYFDPRFGFYSDVDVWMKLAGKYDVAYIPEPLITIPSRGELPHLFNDENGRSLVRKMFWEARMRCYRDRRWRRYAEAMRHGSFVAASRIYYEVLCRGRRQLRKIGL